MSSSPKPPSPIPAGVTTSTSPIDSSETTVPQPQPTPVDKENIPVVEPNESTPSSKQGEEPVTLATPSQPLPEAPTEGEEKHDWEVVNASPSHSPSKDGVNELTDSKGKGRERQKSANSTFGKDGKIGQKIDGVKKVLKSGVFGGSSPKSAPVPTRPGRTTTKPPVPPARPATSKLSSSTTAASAVGKPAVKPIIAPVVPRAGRPSVSASKPPTTAGKTTETATTGPRPLALASSVSSATVRPSASTSTIRSKPVAPRASVSGATIKAVSVPTSRVTSDSQRTTSTTGRRESNASTISNRSTLATNPVKPVVKPRASLPVTTKPAVKGAMGPPATTSSSSRSVPARGSIGPGSFLAQNKATEELKITDLEKQLADKTKENEERLEAAEKEKSELQIRHAKEVAAIQSTIDGMDEKNNIEMMTKLAELKSDHEREVIALSKERETSEAEIRTKLDQITAAHARLQEELHSRTTDLEAHQRGVDQARKAHAEANDALAELRAARDADEAVLGQVKEELARKEQLLAQAMSDLQAASQIEEKLRGREEEIEQVRAEHQVQLATLREQASGTDEAAKAKHEAEIERLKGRIKEIADEAHTNQEKSRDLQTLLDQRQQDLETANAAVRSAEDESKKHQTRLAKLEEELASSQEKHDGLLIEAAQMSDTKIAELSEQLQHAVSLKNEAIAELEHERAASAGSKEREETLIGKEAEATSKIRGLQEEIEQLHVEMAEMKHVHAEKYAAAFEEARHTTSEEHSQDLLILKQELTATHTQLITNHQAELNSMENAHSMKIADLQADHQIAFDKLKADMTEKLEMAAEDSGKVRQVVLGTQHSLDVAEGENRDLQARLEEAITNAGSGSDSDQKLKDALRRIGDMQDELDSTKAMADMNKSHFATMLEELKEEHAAGLEARTAEALKKADALQQERDMMADQARREVDTAKAELEVERQVGRNLSAEVQALRRRIEQWSTTDPKAHVEILQGAKTPKKGRHSGAPSMSSSKSFRRDWEGSEASDPEAANSSYITAKAEQSVIRGETGDARSESGESEASRDTENSVYPTSSSDEAKLLSANSPDSTPEQPSERRSSAMSVVLSQLAQQIYVPSSNPSNPHPKRLNQNSPATARPSRVAAPACKLEEALPVDDMSDSETPLANTTKALPVVAGSELEDQTQGEASPTPRKASTKDDQDDGDESNSLQLHRS